MSTFLTALFSIFVIVLVLMLIGLYLMSKMVGGFGNLRALYRLFTGRGRQGARQQSAKSSSSGKSSRTYNNKSTPHESKAQADGKMFGQNEGTYVEFEEVK